MKYSPQQYAQALYGALQGKTAQESEGIADNLFALMKKNRDFILARKVIDIFEYYARKREGIFSGELVSARPLDESVKIKIKNKIVGLISENKKVQVKDIELKEKLDADLIGGFRVLAGGLIADFSVLKMLKLIKKEINI